METDLHSILTLASNFIKSPAEVEAHRKVDLEDKKIKEETRQEFNKLCDRFDDIISKGSDDIGKTLLVEMDIDTGDSPPIASKPYTLSLKHYDWVQKEITTLEKAGIITEYFTMGITSGDSTEEISPRRTPTEENVRGFQETEQTTT